MTISPVRPVPTDSAVAIPEAGMALCLSGGGYRAMVFFNSLYDGTRRQQTVLIARQQGRVS